MTLIKTTLIAITASVGLSGCIIVTDRDNDFDDYNDSWKERQSDNRAAISQLKIGMPINEVTNQLGGADDSEGFSRDGVEYIVLFYRTQHRHSDGETTRDETTPLVFENGKLLGWGNAMLDSLRAR